MKVTPVALPALRTLLAGGAQLLEVLPPEAYAGAHLPGAVNIPLKSFDAATTADLDQQRPVVVFCWDGC